MTTSTSPPNVFDLYFDYVQDTEPPILLHRWALIAGIGALLGRRTWLPFGTSRLFPNQYVMMIAEAGARKSTAIKILKKVLRRAGYSSFSADKTTKEKFLMDLEGGKEEAELVTADDVLSDLLTSSATGMDPRETFIAADEFNDFMRCGDLEFQALLGALWDWDDEEAPYEHRLKNSRSLKIYQPTLSILGGNTHVGFNEMFPPQALGQGFLSRMLLVFSEKGTRKIAFPEPPSPDKEQSLLRELKVIQAKASGPMRLTPRAKEIVTTLYNSYQPLDDRRFASYSNRRHTHLLKLCIICAAIRKVQTIDIEDVIFANTLLTYTEHFMPRALGEFGKARNADVQQQILDYLMQNSGRVVSDQEIWRQVYTNLERHEDLMKLLVGLQQANKIQYVKPNGEIRSAGFLVVRKAISDRNLYVNFSLLREYDHVKL